MTKTKRLNEVEVGDRIVSRDGQTFTAPLEVKATGAFLRFTNGAFWPTANRGEVTVEVL